MRELSLFSGAGGGLLATHHLLGWECIGYVEINDYCQQVIKQRIEDGLLPQAPTFGDIRAFIDQGYAERYRGMVDVITAGFPCQPFSIAGSGLAEEDDRNMWPETRESIRIIAPECVFLENVPGLLSSDYAITIFNELAEIGYEVLPPLRLGADDVGANHRRKRIWIVAYAGSRRSKARINDSASREKGKPNQPDNSSENVSDASGEGLQKSPQGQFGGIQEQNEAIARRSVNGRSSEAEPGSWWAVEPDVGRVVDGVAYILDKFGAA